MKIIKYLLLLVLILMSACSSNSESNSASQGSSSSESMDNAVVSSEAAEEKASNFKSNAQLDEEKKIGNDTRNNPPNEDRMIIYHANMNIEVDDYNEVRTKIEQLVHQMNGYIVHSEVHDVNDHEKRGTVKVRIPQESFQSFLETVESLSVKINSSNVTGQDVTEEYVDLEARLKSKLVVEARLLEFMKEANETKDLLQISKDLERIQSEIEQLKGKMQYLKDQTNLSTVTISITESKVIVPSIEKDGLNTFDNIKKQFMQSVNFLITSGSTVAVFLIGNSPIFIVLITIGMAIWYFVKKRKSGRSE